MLSDYIHAALKHVKYENLDTKQLYAEIPEFTGVWATGSTMEECRQELIEVIEGWLFLKIKDGDVIPGLLSVCP
jgi:predicted RNase H-like HicB family nuclease